MEIATLASAAVGYLVSWLKESKGVQQASDDLSSGLWNWIKPLFIENEKPLDKLKEAPDKASAQTLVSAQLVSALEEQPGKVQELSALLEQLKAEGKQPARTNILHISGSQVIANQGNEGSTITIGGIGVPPVPPMGGGK